MPSADQPDLSRIPNRPLVIYSGRFQPLHLGHKAVYDKLVAKYGPNVYLATSNKTDPIRSPFSFQDKEIMARAANIPSDKVMLVKNPYVADEIKSLFDPTQTIAIFAIGEKDMEEDPRFAFTKEFDKVAKKKDGTLAYLQPWRGGDKAETMDKHAYVDVIPTVEFNIKGKPLTSATEIRKMYAAADTAGRDTILKDLYGQTNKELRVMFDRALTNKNMFESLIQQLDEIQKETEIMPPKVANDKKRPVREGVEDHPMFDPGLHRNVIPLSSRLRPDGRLTVIGIDDKNQIVQYLNDTAGFDSSTALHEVKHRDPNWKTIQAKRSSGAAGTHKDKRVDAKLGKTKHKKSELEKAAAEMSESKEDPVAKLKKRLDKMSKPDYTKIDKVMKLIAKEAGITAAKLHKLWMSKHKKTPDTYAAALHEAKGSEQDYLTQIPNLTWKPVSRSVWNTIQDEGLNEEQDAPKHTDWIMASLTISPEDARALQAFDNDAIEDFNRFDIHLKSRHPGLTDLIDYDRGTVTIVKPIQMQGVAEGSAPLSVQQLATISDEALDKAYGYGRSTPGNTFGWQANLKSAAYAKHMIDKGVTDIEAISDAIHKGWNVTAQAFVKNPDQFDDTEKLRAAGKLEAKLQQRAKLMNIEYAQLSDEEQEKDRVVARAMLQAITGEQGVAEGSLNEYRDQLWTWVQSKFPRTQWPEYVQRDFLYAKAKGNKNQKDLEDFLDEIQRDFGNCKWTLTKIPITLDIFTPKTQRMIQSREGGSSNPFQVPKDAERHALQSQMIQQKGVSAEPIIVAKLANGYDLIEGWHRTIQHLKAFPQGYTGPAWVCTGATYKSESVEQGVAEGLKFRSKQECIDYFVRQGKSSAQGAAAWERMSTAKPKTVKPFDPNKHSGHWWQKDENINEIGGVGVVKGGNDPRYSMSTAGDQNAVTGNTLGKEMQAFGLIGRKNPGINNQQKSVKKSVGQGKY